MVDPERQPTQDEGDSPFFNDQRTDAEFSMVCTRIEQIATAHSLLSRALELDRGLAQAGEISKSFVSRSGGNDRYPFAHYRIKLRPKNRVKSGIRVSAIRFPTDGIEEIGSQFVAERLFVSWEMQTGTEHAYVLDSEAFSRLEIEHAFEQPDDSGRWPSLDARTQTDSIDQFHLASILSDFEPDLQTHDSDLKA